MCFLQKKKKVFQNAIQKPSWIYLNLFKILRYSNNNSFSQVFIKSPQKLYIQKITMAEDKILLYFSNEVGEILVKFLE